jgi:hypothetical protein
MAMKAVYTVVLAACLVPGVAGQQEKPVPEDSIRISIPGCSRGVMFTVTESPEHESRSLVAPGRRFRMAGKRELLDEIRGREGTMIEVTGIVKKSQVDQSGVAVGDRVRISPGPTPGAGVSNNPNFNQNILDVEGWRQLAGSCPTR